MTHKEDNQTSSAWAPFAYPAFTVLWIATVVSNVGTWMQDVGAAWLMTELAPSPVIVAAVQAATTLPVFLFALIAGAVADIVDRRRLLIVVNILTSILAGIFAVLVSLEQINPILLLVLTFALGTCAAFIAPAWQAIVPQLVERRDLPAAIALNSIGINISRAIGPALAGALIVATGLAAPFAVNAVCTLAIVGALLWWKPPAVPARRLPPEHVFGAIRSGLHYTFNSPAIQHTLTRAAAFFVFASAFWALLPLVARDVLEGGATFYGILLASVGTGAVSGAFVLPRLRRRLGGDGIVLAGTSGTAFVLVLLAIVPSQAVALMAGALAGLSWIAVLSSLHVAAQTALPDWVRARGLSVFLTVFFGAMSFGSLGWGQLATMTSIPTALLVAAAGIVVAAVLTRDVALSSGPDANLAPSSHWPQPIIAEEAVVGDGPVRIEVSYRIEAPNQSTFIALLPELRQMRQRTGGYQWALLQEASDSALWIESWYEPSWLDHLRTHDRVTEDDFAFQERLRALHSGPEAPAVRHLLSSAASGLDSHNGDVHS